MLAVIGGSGLDDFGHVTGARKLATTLVASDYGVVEVSRYAHFYFLARHGSEHKIAPHLINYRANIAALKQLGVRRIIAVYAVGAVNPQFATGGIFIPEQLIDYTHGREHSFDNQDPMHIDFSEPFAADLSLKLQQMAAHCGERIQIGGCYGVSQGPRLETKAEIARMARDGCDLVGMTAMPEAALAREAGIALAPLCLCVNPAAGVGEPLSLEAIYQQIEQGIVRIGNILLAVGSA